jgi:hypothetical protein
VLTYGSATVTHVKWGTSVKCTCSSKAFRCRDGMTNSHHGLAKHDCAKLIEVAVKAVVRVVAVRVPARVGRAGEAPRVVRRGRRHGRAYVPYRITRLLVSEVRLFADVSLRLARINVRLTLTAGGLAERTCLGGQKLNPNHSNPPLVQSSAS